MTDHLLPPPPTPASPQPGTGKKPIWKRRWVWITAVVVVVIGIAASQSSSDKTQTAASETTATTSGDAPPTTAGPTTTEGPEPSASAKLACRHWYNVVSDGAAGILTPSETREKAREVYDDAQVADEPAVRTAARDLLAALTQGDDFVGPGSALITACQEAGVRLGS